MLFPGSWSWFCHRDNRIRNCARSWWSCHELSECAPITRGEGKGLSLFHCISETASATKVCFVWFSYSIPCALQITSKMMIVYKCTIFFWVFASCTVSRCHICLLFQLSFAVFITTLQNCRKNLFFSLAHHELCQWLYYFFCRHYPSVDHWLMLELAPWRETLIANKSKTK